MGKVIHIEVQHGDIVYVHRKHHWWVERFDYTVDGFNKTDTFPDDVPSDVWAYYSNTGTQMPSIEESDAQAEPSEKDLGAALDEGD
jgi:hypothetical protein